MLVDVNALVTDNLDIWSSTIKAKAATGRGSKSKRELYGVKKLRELILELAVRGLLVPQDPNDEPVNVLLKKVSAERSRQIADGIVRKQKLLPPIIPEEFPFELPKGWQWIRNNEVFVLTKGKKPKAIFETDAKGYSPYLDIEALDRGNILRYTDDKKCPKATPQDILVVCDGSRSGLVLRGRDGVIGSTLARIDTPKVVRDYVELFFKQAYVKLNSSMKGAAIPHLDTKTLRTGVMGLPPESELHRIVTKVNELMTLCDQLEQQQENSITAHQTLVETLLNALVETASHTQGEKGSNKFQQAWQCIAENFDLLFTTEHSIEQLKQTILQLAVMGKLVPQDPNDEPASVLLEKIAAEKAQLIKDKKIKKQKPLPPISDEEKPFELPVGWEFSHMQDICSLITDGTHQTPKYTDSGRPFVSAQCVKPFRFIPEKCRYVSEEHYQAYIKNRKPEFGDILLARVGAGIGEAALIDIDLEFAIYVSTGLLKPFKKYLISEYLVLWLNSPVGRYFSKSNTLGVGVSQGNLNLSLIRGFLVSCPPFDEQYRIVAKINELMTLCDNMLEQIKVAQTIQLNLTDAIAEQAVS